MTIMDKDTTAQLQKTTLFRGLPEQALSELAEKVTKRELAEGQVLFRKGDKGDALFVVCQGWVKIVTEDAQGGELILNRCGPGESFGEMSLLDEEPRSAGVVALSQAEVLELKRDAFLEVLNKNPALSLLVIREISGRLRYSTTYIEKAIELSKKIGEGDYSLALNQLETEQPLEHPASDEDKAGQLLAAFFSMVKGVKEREDSLKQQLQKLTIEIDEARRKKEFEEIAQTDFYADLKSQAKRLRQQRTDKN
jgi:CRP-like cAMP-binding protein